MNFNDQQKDSDAQRPNNVKKSKINSKRVKRTNSFDTYMDYFKEYMRYLNKHKVEQVIKRIKKLKSKRRFAEMERRRAIRLARLKGTQYLKGYKNYLKEFKKRTTELRYTSFSILPVEINRIRPEDIAGPSNAGGTNVGGVCIGCGKKTSDIKRICHNNTCNDNFGLFCKPCLKNRLGDDAVVDLDDVNWHCPKCKNKFNYFTSTDQACTAASTSAIELNTGFKESFDVKHVKVVVPKMNVFQIDINNERNYHSQLKIPITDVKYWQNTITKTIQEDKSLCKYIVVKDLMNNEIIQDQSNLIENIQKTVTYKCINEIQWNLRILNDYLPEDILQYIRDHFLVNIARASIKERPKNYRFVIMKPVLPVDTTYIHLLKDVGNKNQKYIAKIIITSYDKKM